MTRLEAVVNSALSFRRELRDGVEQYAEPAETVGVVFDGRLFVWHAFPDKVEDVVFGPWMIGPSVTSVLGDDDYKTVATELERFLSALVFLYDAPAEVAHYGSSHITDPYAEPYARGPRSPGWARKKPFDTLTLRRDAPALLKALAWYREGMNAGSPFYRFLAYWNALEATFEGESQRAAFVDRVTPTLAAAWTDYPLPRKPSVHFQEASRHAIAHVVRYEGRPMVDPDSDTDRQRLEWESRFIAVLTRAAIRERFGEPVRGGWFDPE